MGKIERMILLRKILEEIKREEMRELLNDECTALNIICENRLPGSSKCKYTRLERILMFLDCSF